MTAKMAPHCTTVRQTPSAVRSRRADNEALDHASLSTTDLYLSSAPTDGSSFVLEVLTLRGFNSSTRIAIVAAGAPPPRR
jgi:hypothetical protein